MGRRRLEVKRGRSPRRVTPSFVLATVDRPEDPLAIDVRADDSRRVIDVAVVLITGALVVSRPGVPS